MISFLGLDFQPENVRALALGRDLGVAARTDAAIAGGTTEAAGGVISIPAAEWLRAGGFALQELYGSLPNRLDNFLPQSCDDSHWLKQ